MINIGLGGHGKDHRDSDNQCPLWYVISFPVPGKAVMSEKVPHGLACVTVAISLINMHLFLGEGEFMRTRCSTPNG